MKRHWREYTEEWTRGPMTSWIHVPSKSEPAKLVPPAPPRICSTRAANVLAAGRATTLDVPAVDDAGSVPLIISRLMRLAQSCVLTLPPCEAVPEDAERHRKREGRVLQANRPSQKLSRVLMPETYASDFAFRAEQEVREGFGGEKWTLK
jgi:hypothetical protein